jgi:tRNA nucleotidyltransferase (CCA-adding enzyme)
MAGRWEHFSHDADIGIRGFGATPAEAFEQAALAMSAAICELGTIGASESIAIKCQAPDRELLFVEWLNALIYEMSTRRMLFSRFTVQLDGGQLQGRAWGEPVDRMRHEPAVEIKGATYTALRVAQQAGEWVAQTVVDV